MMLSIFLGARLLFLCFLWWCICSDLLLIPLLGFFLIISLVLRIIYILWIQILHHRYACKYFLPICGLMFYFPNSVFWGAEDFNFHKNPVHPIFHLWFIILESSLKKKLCLTQGYKDFLFSFRSFIVRYYR